MVQFGMFPLCPMVQDRQWDPAWGVVQFWDVPTLSLPSHGTLGWDGQWDAGMPRGGGIVWDVPILSLVHWSI